MPDALPFVSPVQHLLTQAAALAAEIPEVAAKSPASAAKRASGYEIVIEGAIGFDVTAADVRAALKGIPAGAPLTVLVNSPGGSALDGFAIFNMLAQHGGPVTARVNALAASAASYIVMAASRIEMHDASMMMIHNASLVTMGTKADHAASAEILGKIDAIMVRIYAARTGLEPAAITAMMDAETYMDGPEALAKGFATHLLGAAAPPASPTSLAAQAIIACFRMPPAQIAAMGQKQSHTKEHTHMSVTLSEPGGAAVPVATHAELAGIARRANLDTSWVTAQAAASATKADAVSAALDAMATAHAAAVTPSTVRALPEGGETTHDAESEYIAARILGRAPTGAAASLRGYTIADVMAHRLQQRGQHVGRGMAAEQIFARLTTSDLPSLLSSGASRAMAELYPTLRTRLVELAQIRDLPDFRPTTLIRLAQHKPLDLVNEGGEVTAAFPMENGEQIKLATFANIFPVSREALVNDDLGGLAEWMMASAQGAAARERLLAAGLLTAGAGLGPTLSDALPWFDATRGNIGTSGVLSATSLADAVALMRSQKDGKGNIVFALEPYAIVVSPAREYLARQLVAALTTTTTRAEVQPYDLTVIVEPALTGNRWWLAPRPVTRRCITMGYLHGQQTPTVETFTSPEVLGATLRIHFDVAAAVQDPIGWVTNAGV
ncbi:head maturation protease, ClpP-related [Humitalea sp. 24SJ18S-53]|uniref:head maturation protease, ClpP-related n=1 Tax=Humitalea sp. 24SJ18S-53 TaxID=3422307 RepID=UPI003D678BE7